MVLEKQKQWGNPTQSKNGTREIEKASKRRGPRGSGENGSLRLRINLKKNGGREVRGQENGTQKKGA